MHHHSSRSAVAAAVHCTVLSLSVCGAPSASAQSSSLNEVTITGNPLGRSELVAPTTQLQGDDLTLRARPTLGETLDGLPGVSST